RSEAARNRREPRDQRIVVAGNGCATADSERKAGAGEDPPGIGRVTASGKPDGGNAGERIGDAEIALAASIERPSRPMGSPASTSPPASTKANSASGRRWSSASSAER